MHYHLLLLKCSPHCNEHQNSYEPTCTCVCVCAHMQTYVFSLDALALPWGFDLSSPWWDWSILFLRSQAGDSEPLTNHTYIDLQIECRQ